MKDANATETQFTVSKNVQGVGYNTPPSIAVPVISGTKPAFLYGFSILL